MLASEIRFSTLGAQSEYGDTQGLPDRIKQTIGIESPGKIYSRFAETVTISLRILKMDEKNDEKLRRTEGCPTGRGSIFL